MDYQLVRSDGSLILVPHGTANSTDTSMPLPGDKFSPYGQLVNQNLVRMLENFSNSIAPANPIPGQLWFNKNTKVLSVNIANADGVNDWAGLVYNSGGSIGTSSQPIETLYVKNINDAPFLNVHTSNFFTTNLGSSTKAVTSAFINAIGSVGSPVSDAWINNIRSVNTIGTPSAQVTQIYANAAGTSAYPMSAIFVNTITASTVVANTMNASDLAGNPPSYYLDYNNFTNLPNLGALYVARDGSGAMTGLLTLANIDPVSPTHATTKQYVDRTVWTTSFKNAVWLATTGPITLFGNQVIDGVATATNDRILVKNQANPGEAGIWLAQPGAWVRAKDASITSPSTWTGGDLVVVRAGTQNRRTGWIASGAISPPFVKVFDAEGTLPGSGISVSGNTVSVDNTVVRTTTNQVIQDTKVFTETTVFEEGISSPGPTPAQITGSWEVPLGASVSSSGGSILATGPAASNVDQGILRLATDLETVNGVNSTTAVPPSALQAKVDQLLSMVSLSSDLTISTTRVPGPPATGYTELTPISDSVYVLPDLNNQLDCMIKFSSASQNISIRIAFDHVYGSGAGADLEGLLNVKCCNANGVYVTKTSVPSGTIQMDWNFTSIGATSGIIEINGLLIPSFNNSGTPNPSAFHIYIAKVNGADANITIDKGSYIKMTRSIL